MIVFDLDGDGRAEIALKSGTGDPRGPDGRVDADANKSTRGGEILCLFLVNSAPREDPVWSAIDTAPDAGHIQAVGECRL